MSGQRVMRSSRGLTGAVALGGLLLGVPAHGHHSFAAYYHEDQEVVVDGVITEVQFRAPHAWVHVATIDASGRAIQVAAEWSNPSRLERDGISRDTLQVDDRVRIWGSPSRNPDNRMHLKRIARSRDGFQWTGGRRRTR